MPDLLWAFKAPCISAPTVDGNNGWPHALQLTQGLMMVAMMIEGPMHSAHTLDGSNSGLHATQLTHPCWYIDSKSYFCDSCALSLQVLQASRCQQPVAGPRVGTVGCHFPTLPLLALQVSKVAGIVNGVIQRYI
eukprot:1153297-Pelagomonas_calceolata.AAC.8